MGIDYCNHFFLRGIPCKHVLSARADHVPAFCPHRPYELFGMQCIQFLDAVAGSFVNLTTYCSSAWESVSHSGPPFPFSSHQSVRQSVRLTASVRPGVRSTRGACLRLRYGCQVKSSLEAFHVGMLCEEVHIHHMHVHAQQCRAACVRRV